MIIWLAYVNYPITTAVYLERTMRRSHTVRTVGPRLPDQAIEAWGLQNMRLPLGRLDIDTSFAPDMAALLADTSLNEHPDLYLWVESVNGYHPQNLEALKCPKACYLIDTHYHLSTALETARQFDYVFIAQLIDLDAFRAVHPRVYWLPLACDPEIHGRHDVEKRYDVGFVGGINPRRQKMLNFLSQHATVHQERAFWQDMARTFSACRVVLNDASFDDLNMRFFEALASGSLLLSNHTNGSGQDVLFRDGEEYASHCYANLGEVVRHYLSCDLLREQVAEQGAMRVHAAHTYRHRTEDLIDVISHGKKDTYSPFELRERSLVLPRYSHHINHPIRENISIQSSSDYISQTEIITTAATDPAAADIAIRQSCHEFIFLAKPGITPQNEIIRALAEPLVQNNNIACTSLAGCFVNHALLRDIMIISGADLDRVVAVDAPIPFPLMLRRSLWVRHGLLLADGCTSPRLRSYAMGYRIASAGLSCCVVPCRGIDVARNQQQTTDAATETEMVLFRDRWNARGARADGDITSSNWYRYATNQTEHYLDVGRIDEAFSLLEMLYNDYATLPALHDWSIALGKRHRHAGAYIERLYRLQWIFGTQLN